MPAHLITSLPNDLNTVSTTGIQLFAYHNDQDIIKTKVQLTKHTISFLRNGTKEVVGHGKAVHIDNGSFLIMKSGNCLMTEKTTNPNETYQSTLLFFDELSALQILEKHQLSTSEPQLNPNSFYTFEYDIFIEQFVTSLEALLQLPPSVQAKLLYTKFEEIILYLVYQHGPSFLNAIVHQTDDAISRLIHVVENNRYNRLSLNELAFLCNMSISSFKRAFSKQFQSPPMKWFHAQRLDRVALLLKTQRSRPIDLYEEAGYENFSNFVQAFKKKFGVTPKQYQHQY